MSRKSARSNRPAGPAVAALFAIAISGPLRAQHAGTVVPAPATVVAGDFAGAPAGKLPSDWVPLNFPGITAHTEYTPVKDGNLQVVRATAVASASGLINKRSFDVRAHGLLRWRWKVGNLIAGSEITRRQGDDYPARMYVSFAYDPLRATWAERAWYGVARLLYGEYPPHSGLNYVWDRRAPIGTIVTSPFTSRVKMLVVDSGAAHVGQWRAHERNILDDYRRAFGEDPPLASGIAIMTDTDNTGESAIAYYGNIELAPAGR